MKIQNIGIHDIMGRCRVRIKILKLFRYYQWKENPIHPKHGKYSFFNSTTRFPDNHKKKFKQSFCYNSSLDKEGLPRDVRQIWVGSLGKRPTSYIYIVFSQINSFSF